MQNYLIDGTARNTVFVQRALKCLTELEKLNNEFFGASYEDYKTAQAAEGDEVQLCEFGYVPYNDYLISPKGYAFVMEKRNYRGFAAIVQLARSTPWPQGDGYEDSTFEEMGEGMESFGPLTLEEVFPLTWAYLETQRQAGIYNQLCLEV